MADFDLEKLKELGTEAAQVASSVKSLGENIVEKSKELFGKAENGTKEEVEDAKKDAEMFFDKAKEALGADKKDLEKFEKDAKAALRNDKTAIRDAAEKIMDH